MLHLLDFPTIIIRTLYRMIFYGMFKVSSVHMTTINRGWILARVDQMAVTRVRDGSFSLSGELQTWWHGWGRAEKDNSFKKLLCDIVLPLILYVMIHV